MRLLFSGDTIIAKEYWGTQELVRAWCRFAGKTLGSDSSPLYWLLISKGYRTYMYLPLFFRNYLPAPASQPGFEQSLLSAAARERFGQAFQEKLGILDFGKSLGQLRPELCDLKNGSRHARFFARCNPEFKRGTELVCLARISPDNMRSLALRCLKEGLQLTKKVPQ